MRSACLAACSLCPLLTKDLLRCASPSDLVLVAVTNAYVNLACVPHLMRARMGGPEWSKCTPVTCLRVTTKVLNVEVKVFTVLITSTVLFPPLLGCSASKLSESIGRGLSVLSSPRIAELIVITRSVRFKPFFLLLLLVAGLP